MPGPLLTLYLPDFRVQLHLRRRRLGPQALLAVTSPVGHRVIQAASPAARKLGVRSGMTTPAAHQVVPELLVEAVEPELYEEEQRRMLEALLKLAPCIEPAGLGLFYLAWSGLEGLYFTPAEFAHILIDSCQDEGWSHPRVGIGPCRFVARAAAVVMDEEEGPIEVQEGSEVDFLDPLPLGLLPAGPELLQRIEKVGVTTLGQLRVLPTHQLTRRYGAIAATLQRLTRGIDPYRLRPYQEARRYQQQIHLEAPLGNTEQLLAGLEGPIAELLTELALCGLTMTRLKLLFRLESGTVLERQLAPATTAFSPGLWLELLALDLEQLFRLLRQRRRDRDQEESEWGHEAIIRVDLEAIEHERARPPQEGLLGQRQPPPGALDLTLAHLAGLLGEGALRVYRLVPEHRPELRYQRTAARPDLRLPAQPPLPGSLPLGFRLFRPPHRVEVVCDDLERPVWLRCGHQQIEVLERDGPYLLDIEWWSDPRRSPAEAPAGGRRPDWLAVEGEQSAPSRSLTWRVRLSQQPLAREELRFARGGPASGWLQIQCLEGGSRPRWWLQGAYD